MQSDGAALDSWQALVDIHDVAENYEDADPEEMRCLLAEIVQIVRRSLPGGTLDGWAEEVTE